MPGNQRPSPETVADWVTEAVNDSKCDGLPTVIEGGSVTAAMALYRRKIPTHVVVFDAEVRNAENLVRARLLADKMTANRMLAEARAVRASGHESTWVVRESLLYPKLIAVLDHKTRQNDIMSGLQSDWQRLVAAQQQWFNDLRALYDVVVLPPSMQSAKSIMELIDFGNV
jgi:tRNA A37 N6-isopentenylltransferase MiaA